jgi:hypothetical protein
VAVRVQVRDLPPDVTTAALVAHFSALYALDTMDRAGRRPVAGAAPVSYGLLAPFPSRDETQGTWVADIVLFRKIGRLLGGFKSHHALVDEYHRRRSEALMYSEGTAFKHGPDPRRRAHASAGTEKEKEKIRKLTEGAGGRVWPPRHSLFHAAVYLPCPPSRPVPLPPVSVDCAAHQARRPRAHDRGADAGVRGGRAPQVGGAQRSSGGSRGATPVAAREHGGGGAGRRGQGGSVRGVRDLPGGSLARDEKGSDTRNWPVPSFS